MLFFLGVSEVSGFVSGWNCRTLSLRARWGITNNFVTRSRVETCYGRGDVSRSTAGKRRWVPSRTGARPAVRLRDSRHPSFQCTETKTSSSSSLLYCLFLPPPPPYSRFTIHSPLLPPSSLSLSLSLFLFESDPRGNENPLRTYLLPNDINLFLFLHSFLPL